MAKFKIEITEIGSEINELKESFIIEYSGIALEIRKDIIRNLDETIGV